jgi:hypothetical protein
LLASAIIADLLLSHPFVSSAVCNVANPPQTAFQGCPYPFLTSLSSFNVFHSRSGSSDVAPFFSIGPHQDFPSARPPTQTSSSVLPMLPRPPKNRGSVLTTIGPNPCGGAFQKSCGETHLHTSSPSENSRFDYACHWAKPKMLFTNLVGRSIFLPVL